MCKKLSWRFLALAVVCFLIGCFPSNPVAPDGVNILPSVANSKLEPISRSVFQDGSTWSLKPAVRIPAESFSFYSPTSDDDSITSMVVARSGDKVYLGTRKGLVLELSRDSGSNILQRRVLYSSSRPVFALALSRDSSRLAVAQYSYVAVIGLGENKLLSQLTLVDGRILSLAWDASGELLALGRANGDVFVWDGNTNNSRELERYSAATSPVTRLEFHPKARALFVMERNGGLYLWRILRTEYQLGLRDETAEIDKAQQGRVVVGFAVLPGQATGMWLDSAGTEILGLSQIGQTFSWAVRGLVRGQVVSVGPLNASALAGINVQLSPLVKRTLGMMLVGGRGQQLQVWCRAVRTELLEDTTGSVIVVKPGEGLAPKPPVDPLLMQEDEYEDEEEEVEEEIEETLAAPGLMASSTVMKSTINDIAYASGSVWVVLGDGNIAHLPTAALLSSAAFQSRAKNCITP